MNVRIYLRVSRETEAEIYANQRQTAIAYVKEKLGMDNALVYSEVVSGRTIQARRGLRTLLRDVQREDIVVFTAPSRMTRGGVGSGQDILRYIADHGAYWHFIEYPMLNYDSTLPSWVRDVILAVMNAMDQAYSERIGAATVKGLAKAKAAGHNVGGARRGAGRPRKAASKADEPLEPESLTVA